MHNWLPLVLLVSWVVSLGAQDWDAADRATKRLAPSVFVNLPIALRADLERRGCTIPQPFTATRPENVIKGRFTSPDQTDWAVLCSRRQVSSILVFRGGSASAVVEIASQPDRSFLQGIGKGAIGFSRALGIADAKYIQVHYDSYGGPRPPPLDHEGINDIFVEKASVVRYWYRGRWLELTGAD